MRPGAVQRNEGRLHDFFGGRCVAAQERGDPGERLVMRAIQQGHHPVRLSRCAVPPMRGMALGSRAPVPPSGYRRHG
jgi:hypothetical protein